MERRGERDRATDVDTEPIVTMLRAVDSASLFAVWWARRIRIGPGVGDGAVAVFAVFAVFAALARLGSSWVAAAVLGSAPRRNLPIT